METASSGSVGLDAPNHLRWNSVQVLKLESLEAAVDRAKTSSSSRLKSNARCSGVSADEGALPRTVYCSTGARRLGVSAGARLLQGMGTANVGRAAHFGRRDLEGPHGMATGPADLLDAAELVGQREGRFEPRTSVTGVKSGVFFAAFFAPQEAPGTPTPDDKLLYSRLFLSDVRGDRSSAACAAVKRTVAALDQSDESAYRNLVGI